MVRNCVLAASICLAGMGSAGAATLYIPGSAGIADQASAYSQPGGVNDCIADVPKGAMLMHSANISPYYACLMSFPVSLPVGSTIDNVEVAYRNWNSAIPVQPFIAAYLGANRIKPDLGSIAFAGNNATGGPSGQRFLAMSGVNVPIVSGDIYWIQVSTSNITEVSSVSINYH